MPKVGYIAIVGRPNAGKSTFLNALIGEKVSAVSPRPQTTQRSIPGIYTDEEKGVQMIFLDTPGIHYESGEQYGSEKSRDIHDRINSEAFASLHEADVIVRLVDPTRPYGVEDDRIDEVISYSKAPVIRVETKGDLPKGYHGRDIDIHIDSTTKMGFDALITRITELLPEGAYLYSPEYYTDQPMDLRITEVIREILFSELSEEVPYAAYVEIGSIEEKLEGREPMLRVQAYINVETESQKVIVIGKGGVKIQEIGTRSRLALEHIFGKKVFLALRVKVHKNWRKDEKTLEKIFPRK